MKFINTINKEDFKEFKILDTKYKNYYISYYKNKNIQRIDLMANETTFWGEILYRRKLKTQLTEKQIKEIATNILNYKILCEKLQQKKS